MSSLATDPANYAEIFFCALSLKRVKLNISNLAHKLIMASIIQWTMKYDQKACGEGPGAIFKFWDPPKLSKWCS